MTFLLLLLFVAFPLMYGKELVLGLYAGLLGMAVAAFVVMSVVHVLVAVFA
tara:strand:+ start:352 stop:504 length:153 start_codon:yes stop_codon:yes gene_type:complete